MYKFLKKSKVFKVISFLLVIVFAINVTACVEKNDVAPEQNGGGNPNHKIGIGEDITGYTVYSQSTFDPMSKELFMGYLLSGRSFTLVVVPGKENSGDDKEENPYLISDPENYLYAAAQRGILQYDDKNGNYINYEQKALMYYVTNLELVAWFNEFEKDDNFASKALEFASSSIDLEKPSRFKCSTLVNIGSGLNSVDFCGEPSDNKLNGGIITNEKTIDYGDYSRKVFDDAKEGGMILLFSYNSIQGYMTYDHIKAYTGSEIANDLENANCSYTPGSQSAFNYKEILTRNSNQILNIINRDYLEAEDGTNDYNMTISDFENLNTNTEDYQALVGEIISIYTEIILLNKKGCERLKTTYQLLEQGLLTDNNASNLSSLKSTVQQKLANSSTTNEEKDKYNAINDIITMLYNFKSNAAEEAFNVKISVALFDRYSEVIKGPDTDSLVNKGIYNKINNITNTQTALDLATGSGDYANKDYLMIVTAKGFIFDRGDREEREALGMSEMLGMQVVLQELVKMDACPNATIALEMYNMLANLKIAAGIAITVAGATAVAAAAIGLTVASIIAKLAAVSSVTPVPGARIVALVLVAVAGLIAIGVGLYTLFSGAKDKADIKGMGASKTNYCSTYKATFNQLFKTISLTIPVYHYEISKDNDGDGDDAITLDYCDGDIVNGECEGTVKSIPLYYYADREISEQMQLPGMPALLYYKDGELVDQIFGATTPSFIVEILRVWGLLSMREMVYKSVVETEGSKKINVYHTTNTNARTMSIEKAKYCYTLDYELNVWADTGSSFCYYDESNDKMEHTINLSYKSGQLKKAFGIDMPNDDSDIAKKIIEKYSGYFGDKVANRFYSYKDEYFTNVGSSILEENQVIKSVSWSGSSVRYIVETTTYEKKEVQKKDENGNPMTDQNGDPIMVEVLVEKKTESNHSASGKRVTVDGKTYLFGDNGLIYRVNTSANSLSVVNSFKSGHNLSSIKNSLEEMMADTDSLKEDMKKNELYDDSKSQTDNYNTLYDAFITYLLGNVEFEISSDDVTDAQTVSIPLYFTATIRESPQANFYYKNNGTKVTCNAGEYYYKREHWFFGKWYSNECYTDGKVNSKKDTAKSAKSAGKTDEEKYNYYTTSVLIADIVISIDSEGKTAVELQWQ